MFYTSNLMLTGWLDNKNSKIYCRTIFVAFIEFRIKCMEIFTLTIHRKETMRCNNNSLVKYFTEENEWILTPDEMIIDILFGPG
jgi:hypothetical protein